MQHTLVAVFDNRTDAQNAMNELLSSGFSSQDVRLAGSDTSTTTSATTTTTTTDTDTGIGTGIKNFFADLFGSDDDDRASRYQGAVSGGKNVITLTANSLEEVERAADIVEGFGPIDIDESSSGSLGSSGAMRSSTGSGMSSSSMSAQSASTTQQSALTGGSMQRDTSTQSIPVVEEQLKVGKREVQRGGVRIYCAWSKPRSMKPSACARNTSTCSAAP